MIQETTEQSGARLDVPRKDGVTTYVGRPVEPIPVAQQRLEATKAALIAESEGKNGTGL